MTVGQLLASCSSVELTLWQQYLQADAAHQDDRREAARFERSIEG